MINLKTIPYNLGDDDVAWVDETIGNMTLEEKIGQVFFALGSTTEEKVLKQLVEGIGIGGMMYRPANGEVIQDIEMDI